MLGRSLGFCFTGLNESSFGDERGASPPRSPEAHLLLPLSIVACSYFLSSSTSKTFSSPSLGRTHINSCDFSVGSYNFDDVEDDFDLLEFDGAVAHDVDAGMVGMMLLATETAARSFPREASSGYGGMRIVASPWSPPPWMKSPTPADADGAAHAANLTGSAGPVCLRDGVGPDSRYARSWALFFDKFIEACE